LNSFLFVLPTDRLGGAERVTMNLVRYLSVTKPKVIISVVFMSRGDSGGWNDLKDIANVKLVYHDFKSEKSSFPYLVYYLTKNIKNVDFVYATHTHVNALMSALRKFKLFHCNYLVLRESTIISQRFSGFKKLTFDILYKFYGAQDLLICQTDLMRDELVKVRGNVIAHNIKTISNPLNLQHINSTLAKAKVESNHVQNNDFTIVMVGRLAPIKNYNLVINALAELKLTKVKSFKLKVIGDGILNNELHQLSKYHSLQKEVEFLGNIKDPYQYMKEADLGIVSSISEGFPNVLLEMMASGIKNLVITPCTDGLNQLPKLTVTIDHSIEAMVEAISNTIQTPKDYSSNYIEYAKTRDISNFWSVILESIDEKTQKINKINQKGLK
jgi:glycosyltransferase involved in cell wall biosynthesis